MQSLHLLPNQIGCLPAEAVKALAHHGRFLVFIVSGQNAPTKHPKSFIGDPPTFAARWCDPNSRFTSFMDDGQSPLSFQAQNITVGDKSCCNWIHDHNTVCVEHHFGLYPKEITYAAKYAADKKFNYCLGVKPNHQKAICHEQNQQRKRDTSPDKIAFGPKRIVHLSIIAGEDK